MTVIAMTREMATRGKDVAAGLADRLGLTVVHHEVVEHEIAERAGLGESQVHRFLEGEATLLDRWRIDRRRLSRYTAQEILELAAKSNVLIRGWGATYLLRDIPHVLCVRICAPLEARARELMRRLGIDDVALARNEIARNDAAHNGTMQKLFGIDWTDASLYAVVLNTARVPVDDCVEHIVRIAKSPAFQETEETRRMLLDRLVESRVRAELEKRFGPGPLQLGIEPRVAGGRVTLTGACSDEAMIAEAVRLVHGVTGVTGVESRISHIAFRRGTT
jgi:cytidylate kinase